MTCGIESVPIGALQARLAQRGYAERIPLTATLEIIATCNFSCQHCYIAPGAARDDQLSVEDAKLIFAQLVQAGTIDLLLTGGEIFTHRGFREIFRAARYSGFNVYLNTNGYLINERWADWLAEMPPHGVSISLYGLSNERYAHVTGIPRAFDRVVRAIELLGERDIRVDLKCPAMTLTADEIPAMRAFAEARGLPFRHDSIISPHEKGDEAPLQLQLAPRRVLELDRALEPALDYYQESFARAVTLQPSDRVYRCGAGKTSLHINVRGDVSTCVSSRQSVGNVLQEPFEVVWGRLGGKVEKRYPEGHPCATCRFRSVCSGCPATVEQVTGLPDGYVQQYCRITHLRAHAVGLHPTGVPRTVAEGIPAHVVTPPRQFQRALPVLN